MAISEVGVAFQDKTLGKFLKADDKKSLYNFVEYLKNKSKFKAEEDSCRQEQERINSDNSQNLISQKLDRKLIHSFIINIFWGVSPQLTHHIKNRWPSCGLTPHFIILDKNFNAILRIKKIY
jgi:hypothetical protein